MSTKEVAVSTNLPPAAVRDSSSITPNSQDTYTGENIKVLEGLRRFASGRRCTSARPASWLHHLVYEVVDNSVDEALAGHASHVDVTIHIDNSITVVDDGRGIPVDEMEVPAASGCRPCRWFSPSCMRGKVRLLDLQGFRGAARRRCFVRQRSQRRARASRSGRISTPTSRTMRGAFRSPSSRRQATPRSGARKRPLPA